jgi:hypothetical protein
MDVFALILRLKEEGAAAVKSATDQLKKSFDNTSKSATGLDKAMGSLKKAAVAYISVQTVSTVLKKIVEESSTAQFAQAQLEAALKSTGGVAGQTSEALNAHAAALQKVSIFGDDTVKKSQALLLTFTKIGGDTFPRATQSIVDMATAMGTDLQGATIQIGKALNDPILGVTALGRAGVQFSESQKAMIKSLVETNQLADAQNIILKELETQFGGSAQAARNTLGGAMAALNNAFGDLFETSEQGSRGIVSLINLIIEWMEQHAGAIDRFATNFSLGLVVVIGEIGKFVSRIKQAAVNVAAFIVNMFTPLQYLPVIGDSIKKTIDGWTAALRTNYDAVTANMNGWAQWQNTKIRAILTTDAAVKKGGGGGGGGGFGGGELGVAGAPTRAAAGMGAMPGIAMTERVLPPELTPISPAVLERVKASTAVAIDQAKVAMMEQMEQASMEFAANIANTLIGSLAAGIETAVATGSIGEGFKALGETLLSGLGSALQMFGTQAIIAGKLMKKFMEAMARMDPFAAVAAGLGMVALGAALKGAAKAAFGGGSAGGAGNFTGTSLSIGGGMQSSGSLRFMPTTAGQAGQMQPKGSVTVNATIIGPNDPSAQRQIADVVNNAARRGLIVGPEPRTV